MASWTDGAAYAPIERPDAFAMPEAEPLSQAEPPPELTPGAIPPPSGYAPLPPGPALEQLGTPATTTRNPAAPFEVHSALLTATPVPGGQRDPLVPFQVSSLLAPVGPDAPPDPSQLLAQGPYAPGMLPPTPTASPTPTLQRTLILTAAGAFLLTVLVPTAAPYLFAVAGVLMLRTSPEGRQFAWATFTIAALAGAAILAGAATFTADLTRWLGVCFGISCVIWAFNSRPSTGPR